MLENDPYRSRLQTSLVGSMLGGNGGHEEMRVVLLTVLSYWKSRILVVLLLVFLRASPASGRLIIGVSAGPPASDRALATGTVGACSLSVPTGRPVALLATTADSADITLARLHALQRWPVLLTPTVRAQAVVLIAHADHLVRLRDAVHAQHVWNKRARFIVGLRDEQGDGAVRAQHALEVMWAVGAAHVAVVTSDDKDGGKSLEVYTWSPFGGGRCADRVVAELTDRWDVAAEAFKIGADLFAKKVPDRLGGCALTASTFNWPPFIIAPNASTGPFKGLEIALLETIAEACEFTLRFVTTSKILWGGELADGTWTGATGELFHGRVNFSVASYIDQENRHRVFDFSNAYLTNGVVWIVPRAGHTPRWLSLAKVFSPSFWATVVATWALAAVILRLLASTSGRVHTVYSTLASCLSNALAVLLGMSVAHQPTTTTLRIFFMLWCFYCLQINTAYQSTLISVLTEPTYQKQVTNMEELAASNLVLKAFLDYSIYLDDEVALERVIKSRISQNCQEHELCLRQVVDGAEEALLADSAYSNFLIPSMSVGQPRVVPFKNQVFSYFVSMLLPKDGLLTSRFNEVIERVNQAGLMTKWRRDVTLQAAERRRTESNGADRSKSASTASGPVRLTSSHLQGAYIVLGGGLATATLAFLVELTAAHFAASRMKT